MEAPEEEVETKEEESASSATADAPKSGDAESSPATSQSRTSSPLHGMHQASAALSMALIAVGEPYGMFYYMICVFEILMFCIKCTNCP